MELTVDENAILFNC